MGEMGPVLGVDCSADLCGAAVAVGEAVFEREERRPGEQLTWLLPMIVDVLAEAGVERAALARLAVTVGPGSFTGLRLALATVRTMAQILGCPVVPVSTLDAVAWSVADWYFAGSPEASEVHAAVLTDARKGQVFAAAYRAERAGLRLTRTGEPRALDPDAAAAWLKEAGPISLVGGSGLGRYADVFAGWNGMAAPADVAEPHARHVARAGAGWYGPIEAVPYAAVEPLYLRPPDVRPPRRSGAAPAC